MTNMKMNTVILLSLAACTGMLACPGAWATAVCQEQSYHLKTACQIGRASCRERV